MCLPTPPRPRDPPLASLVSRRSDDAVEAALSASAAHVNAANSEGATPLHLATRSAYFYGMDALVRFGCDVNALDAAGVQWCLHQRGGRGGGIGGGGCVSLRVPGSLQCEPCGQRVVLVWTACRSSMVTLVVFVWSPRRPRMVSMSSTSSDLHMSSYNSRLPTLLIGRSAAHEACQLLEYAADVLAFLYSSGSDVTLVDNWGYQPLHYASAAAAMSSPDATGHNQCVLAVSRFFAVLVTS